MELRFFHGFRGGKSVHAHERGSISEQLFWRWVNFCEQKWIRLSERQRESARFDALIAEPDYLHVAKRVGEHPHNAIGPENARPPQRRRSDHTRIARQRAVPSFVANANRGDVGESPEK